MRNELKYVKMLESAELNRDQAEIHLKVIEGAMQDNVATKLELHEAKSELKEKIESVRTELKEDIQNLRTELKEDIQNLRTELKEEIQGLRVELYELRSRVDALESRILIKTGAMVATATALLMAGIPTILSFML